MTGAPLNGTADASQHGAFVHRGGARAERVQRAQGLERENEASLSAQR